MKTSRMWIGMLGLGLGVAISARAEVCTPPLRPSPPVVLQGMSGQPPAFRNPVMPAGVSQMQVEIWKYTATGKTLFARVWMPSGFAPVWAGTGQTNWYLRSGSGPGGFRLFPAGVYRVWYRGYNACGFGPWSSLIAFQVTHTSALSTRIIAGPTRIGSDIDFDFGWSNNFAASRHQVQIRRGAAVVRSTNLPGVFDNGWLNFGYGVYRDRPASPGGELANGTGYVFRVSSWSPVLGRWTAWAERAFTLARGLPANPALSMSQTEYFPTGTTRSPRPYFMVNYGYERIPALWSYFDIRREVGGQLQVVRQQWASRYNTWGYGFGYGANDYIGERTFGGAHAFPDLSAGKYVWRVRAWNGAGAGQSRWTTFRTNHVVAAGTLARPNTNHFGLATSGRITWGATPNAYMYNLAIYRNGVLYATYNRLDPRIHNIDVWWDEVEFSRAPFPAGRYNFRVQAVNLGNPSAQQHSAWSYSPAFVIP